MTTGPTQYSEYSIGGGPFLPLPPIQSAGVQAVPEPAGLATVGLATVAGLLRRRGTRRR